jgi:hypothetical protein
LPVLPKFKSADSATQTAGFETHCLLSFFFLAHSHLYECKCELPVLPKAKSAGAAAQTAGFETT